MDDELVINIDTVSCAVNLVVAVPHALERHHDVESRGSTPRYRTWTVRSEHEVTRSHGLLPLNIQS